MRGLFKCLEMVVHESNVLLSIFGADAALCKLYCVYFYWHSCPPYSLITTLFSLIAGYCEGQHLTKCNVNAQPGKPVFIYLFISIARTVFFNADYKVTFTLFSYLNGQLSLNSIYF